MSAADPANPGGTSSALMQMLHDEADIYADFGPLLPPDLQGWNSEHEALDEAIRQQRPSVVIDVGVWKGGSAIFMAKSMREHRIDGAVIAIDTFLGSTEHWHPHHAALMPKRYGRPLLYEQFLSNVIHCQVEDLIVPLSQTADSAASILARLNIRASVIHIDAAHDYDTVLRDARTYWQLLDPGGYLIGDDYHPHWPGVVRAADEFASSVGAELVASTPKWIVRKQ